MSAPTADINSCKEKLHVLIAKSGKDIRTIDFNNPSEKAIHDKLVSLVDRMLELQKKENRPAPFRRP